MVTQADVKKLKTIFTTKGEMSLGFRELVEFIGETKNDIMKELSDFRNEVNEFRNEMRDINRNSQLILNNHETRIVHLEYTNKS